MGRGGRRVLVLDDEPLVAMLLGDFLDALGYEVAATAQTVAEALSAIDGIAPDLALLDCNLGGQERSWSVADRLTAMSVPFVFSSGLAAQDLPSRFADRPMLAKPFTLAALESTLKKL